MLPNLKRARVTISKRIQQDAIIATVYFALPTIVASTRLTPSTMDAINLYSVVIFPSAMDLEGWWRKFFLDVILVAKWVPYKLIFEIFVGDRREPARGREEESSPEVVDRRHKGSHVWICEDLL